jgi:hypothetical protein
MPDGCGATLACGDCTSPLVCGGEGVLNVCGNPANLCSDAGWCGGGPLTAALSFHGIWGSGRGDLWIVGAGGTVIRGDGGTWTALDSGSSNDLNDVWGTSSADVWAVGSSGTILHWDGAQWAALDSGVSDRLVSVMGLGPADIWATATTFQRGRILHWDGASWATELELEVPVGRVFVLDSAHVWVATLGALLMRDGGGWSQVVGAFPSTNVPSLAASSPSDVWISGGSTAHFDGGEWTVVSPGVRAAATAIVSLAPDDVWAVGARGACAHWDGVSWIPQPRLTTANLYDLWVDEDAIWAVGDGSQTLRRPR